VGVFGRTHTPSPTVGWATLVIATPNTVAAGRMSAHWPEILFPFQKFRKCLSKLAKNSIKLQKS
jgi:hypothetical protein